MRDDDVRFNAEVEADPPRLRGGWRRWRRAALLAIALTMAAWTVAAGVLGVVGPAADQRALAGRGVETVAMAEAARARRNKGVVVSYRRRCHYQVGTQTYAIDAVVDDDTPIVGTLDPDMAVLVPLWYDPDDPATAVAFEPPSIVRARDEQLWQLGLGSLVTGVTALAWWRSRRADVIG